MQSNISFKDIFYLSILPTITGVFLALSALPSRIYFINFIALIPLLFASEYTLNYKKSFLLFLGQLIVTFWVFYLWVGLWVLKTANIGFLLGITIVLPFILLIAPYIFFNKRNSNSALVYFVAAWISAETIQSYFQLGTPFYNLGNSLGRTPALIQWYEYTGSLGGTLWILTVNIIGFRFLQKLIKEQKFSAKLGSAVVLAFIVPIFLSLYIYNNYEDQGISTEILVVHPSTDCFEEKYKTNIYTLMDDYLKIIIPQLTDKTEYVVLPETAITNGGWISDFKRNLIFKHFYERTAEFPNLKLVTGAVTYETIPNIEKIEGYKKIPRIRYSKNYKTWYYTYNSALQIEKEMPVQMRVKESLVPFQEYAPYPQYLPRLTPVGIDFQFSKKKKNMQIFISKNRKKTAALVCYELVFGRNFNKAAKQGAEAFFVLLNEGWYVDVKKVPKQFLQLATIRAIENRRSIAYSSNMGISAFINQKGDVVSSLDNIEPGFLKYNLKFKKTNTLYTTIGNFIGLIASIYIVLTALNELVRKFFTKNNARKF